MSKRTTFTNISPLPASMTREQALGFLHDHLEMIDLNPLVIERHRIEAPPHTLDGEQHCTWYSITDKIEYLPGGVASGDVSYTCAFHDMPDGLQTHCYAPMGTDIRDRWTVAGTMPGEPPQPVELGLGAPKTGLYLREDVELKCNFLMSSFVRKTLSKSHGKLVDTMVDKARKMMPSSSANSTFTASPMSTPSTQVSQMYTPTHSHSVSALSTSGNGIYVPPTLGGSGQVIPQQRWSTPPPQSPTFPGPVVMEHTNRPHSAAGSQQYDNNYQGYHNLQQQYQPYHVPQLHPQYPQQGLAPYHQMPQSSSHHGGASQPYGYGGGGVTNESISPWPAPLNFSKPFSPSNTRPGHHPSSIMAEPGSGSDSGAHYTYNNNTNGTYAAELGGNESFHQQPQHQQPPRIQELSTEYNNGWQAAQRSPVQGVNGGSGIGPAELP